MIRLVNSCTSRSPDFAGVGVLVAALSVGVDVGEVVFEFDTSEDPDDRPGADEVDAAVVVSADQQIRIIVAIQIHPAAQ